MWTRAGRLVDPYEELWVKESKIIDRGMLDKHYTEDYSDWRCTVSVSIADICLPSDGVCWLGERRVDRIGTQHPTRDRRLV